MGKMRSKKGTAQHRNGQSPTGGMRASYVEYLKYSRTLTDDDLADAIKDEIIGFLIRGHVAPDVAQKALIECQSAVEEALFMGRKTCNDHPREDRFQGTQLLEDPFAIG